MRCPNSALFMKNNPNNPKKKRRRKKASHQNPLANFIVYSFVKTNFPRRPCSLPGRGARRRFFRGHQPLQALEWNRPMAWPGYHHINPHNHITSSILSIFFLLLLFTLDGMFDWAQPNCFSFFPVLFPSCCRKCYFRNSNPIHFAVRFDLSAVLLCTSVTKNAIVWLMNVAVLYVHCLFLVVVVIRFFNSMFSMAFGMGSWAWGSSLRCTALGRG